MPNTHRTITTPSPGKAHGSSKRAAALAEGCCNRLRPLVLIVAGMAGVAQTPAQVLPDAGALRQQIEQDRQPAAIQPMLPAKPAEPPALARPQGVVLTVTAFHFSGNTLLGSEQLQNAVADFLHRPLDYTALQAAAAAVAEVYRQSGWVVRAYLPEQDIADGIVTIRIVEAVFGGSRIEGDEPRRVRLDRIQNILNAHQKAGEFLNEDKLDRALLLAGDLPGVGVSGTLREGLRPGETDLVLRFTDDKPVRGYVVVDNSGSRSTGEARANAEINLNSPLGLGDQLSSSLNHSEGSDYLRIGATFPLGPQGWRLGANASVFNYRLVTPEFTALDGRGSSEGAALEASYPLVRTRLKNLYFSVNAEHKTYDNRSKGSVISHYGSSTLSLGLSGTLLDKPGNANSAALTLTSGQLDLGGSPSQANDAASTRTHGAFNKLRYSVSRQQVLNRDWSVYLACSGQWADTNLDSSEKFFLGGATGVRAYPANEAGGATGQMINLELRRRLPGGLTLSGFYDAAQAVVNHHNNFADAALVNDILLRGLGLALAWQADSGLNIKGSWSRRVGDNPNATTTGNDQDGTRVTDRFWLNASLTF